MFAFALRRNHYACTARIYDPALWTATEGYAWLYQYPVYMKTLDRILPGLLDYRVIGSNFSSCKRGRGGGGLYKKILFYSICCYVCRPLSGKSHTHQLLSMFKLMSLKIDLELADPSRARKSYAKLQTRSVHNHLSIQY